MNDPRRLLATVVVTGLLLLAVAAGPTLHSASPPARAAATSIPAGPATWSEVDRLVSEQKHEAAAALVAKIRVRAEAKGDEEEWTRALVREVQLRSSLHGYETAVRFLRENKWPQGTIARVVLEAFYGQTLVNYLAAYGWEIAQREHVQAKDPLDIKTWTSAEIGDEAVRAYARAWAQRGALGNEPIGRIGQYLARGSYPPEVRGTLRDLVSYLLVEVLANTAYWTPEQQELYRLKVESLIGPTTASLDDGSVHPLVKMAAVLSDLEAWHESASRRAAALEARLERLRRLDAAFTDDRDRRLLRADLERRLPAHRDLEWWGLGQAQLAEMVQEEPAPDALVRARALAEKGQAAYPGSIGARQCTHVIDVIDTPAYQLSSMTLDGVRRRSIDVEHKNLTRLYFRAYAVDLRERLRTSRDYNLLPAWQDVPKRIESRPVAQWAVDLPPTPDYRLHRTYVTPPMETPGLYLVVASAQPTFKTDGVANQVQAVNLLVSDLVLVQRTIGDALEIVATSGRTGSPIAGAKVEVWQLDWNAGHHVVETRTTDGDGVVRFDGKTTGSGSAPGWRPGNSVALLGTHGADSSLVGNVYWNIVAPRSARRQSLVYTDRSVYRPQQKILWKVVAYEDSGEDARFQVAPHAELSVVLEDANRQTVETRQVVTNAFGSAAGEFVIPAGRLLGQWTVQSSPGGQARVRVEEYKRPTFEVTFADPAKEMRLNAPATLAGSARYYFGLPVTSGKVSWRVSRQAIAPWWWFFSGGFDPSRRVVAAGQTRVDADGRFTLTFEPEADERAERDLSWTYAVEADVTDEGGETRSASRAFRLGFVSVEARIDDAPGFVRAGEAPSLHLTRTDLDGTPRAGRASWKLFAVRQPSTTLLPADQPVDDARPAPAKRYRTPGDLQRTRSAPQYQPSGILRSWEDGAPITGGDLTHDAKGEAGLTLPPLAAGVYRLRYETKDAAGAVYRMTQEILVVERQHTPLSLPGLLAVERATVSVGETARLLVHSGIAGQPMTLELWRDGRRFDVRHLIAGDSPDVVDLPVTDKDRGGFAATLTLVRDHQLVSQTVGVFVPWSDRILNVAFSTFRDLLRPGSRETWTVTVRSPDPRHAPVGEAEVLASMYDRSLDLFAPLHPTNPVSAYPSRNFAAPPSANLGGAGAVWSSGYFGPLTGDARPIADRLAFWSGYAIGGPGVRGNVVSELLMDAAAPAQAGYARVGGLTGGKDRGLMEGDRELSLNGRNFAKLETRVDEISELKVHRGDASTPVPLRQNFSETAFWEPQLLTGPDGTATFAFTVPDSVTSWKLWAAAVTRDLCGGIASAEARTVKDLMVRPYLPRFLREGDHASIQVVVNNASKQPLSGTLSFEILDPDSGQSVAAEFGVDAARRLTFTAPPSGATHVTVPLAAPKRVGGVLIKVVARAGDLSDGEQRLLPLLPSRLHLVESRFATLKGVSPRTLSFPALARSDDNSRQTDQLVVTLDAQLFYGVLQAVPYLVNYPYECVEQTLNRFVSTGILSSLFDRFPAVGKMAADMAKRETRYEPWDREDPNRRMQLQETPWMAQAKGGSEKASDLIRVLDPKIAAANRTESLTKLERAQTSLGAFPWWPGGPPSPYMTLYVVADLSHAREFGVDVPKPLVVKAFSYLHRHYLDDIVRQMMSCDCGWEFVTYLNYVLTSYPDDSWTGGVFTKQEREQMLEFSFRHWKRHSPYSKGQLALTLKRRGRPQDAALVWDSVMDSAKTDDDTGTSWAPEDRAWLWYNDTTETQAFALRTLQELDPHDARREGLVQWLFLNKKLNHWSSTRSTAEVVYALAYYLKEENQMGVREEAKVTVGPVERTFVFEPDAYTGKANHMVVPGATVDAAHVSGVVVEKKMPGMMFASATWHYSTDRLPTDEAGDLFAVSRRFFRRENRDGQWTLVPIAQDTTLVPGDEVEVQLSLRAKQAAEYVHLRDPRGAGFEPVSLVSGFKWQTGIGYYEEVHDSGESFFFEWLPAGEYTFHYRVRAATGGTFRVGPAEVQSMYAPEFAARSAGTMLRISDADAPAR